MTYFSDFHGLIENAEDDSTKRWLKSDPRNLLFAELYLAEVEARKGGKRKTFDTHIYEANIFENLIRLRDALWEYEYKPCRGTAHVVFRPVQREIFAAPYVDRIVHHFVVNNLIDWWETRLHYDSCSCREGKGTLFGVRRLRDHMRSVSQNFAIPTDVIKMDISGYFMHIRRDVLFEKVMWGVDKIFVDKTDRRYKILRHAIREIIFDNPVAGVKIQGTYEDWRGLPEDKSLFCQPPGQGMVIGNLTSQFFSNIYLDSLDRFITQELGYKHYGRYVDDFYIVVPHSEKEKALRDVAAIGTFLQGLGLTLNRKKTRVIPTWQGVPFLGTVVKNNAILPGKRIVRNFNKAAIEFMNGENSLESVVSYLGLMYHYDDSLLVDKVFDRLGWERRK